jgi:energy-coupling factor transporter ATP-binding protein EcfA2
MTATPSLKHLKLAAFRGSTTEFKMKFDKGKKLTLVYGENGCGKTTVCDAFEFLSNERISSLDNRGLGKGLDSYWHSSGKLPSDLVVDLETTVGVWKGTISNKKALIASNAGKLRIELLRRQQILNIIEAPPGERYIAIKHFIDVESIELAELNLKQSAKALESEIVEARRRENENLETLHGFFEAALKPAHHSPLSWAVEQLKTAGQSNSLELQAVEAAIKSYSDIDVAIEQFEKLNSQLALTKEKLDQAEILVGKAVLASAEGALDTINMLKAAESLLHNHDTVETCPLCESSDRASDLKVRLSIRIEKLAALSNAVAERDECRNHHSSQLNIVNQRRMECLTVRESLLEVTGSSNFPGSVAKIVTPPGEIEPLKDWLINAVAQVESWKKHRDNLQDSVKFKRALGSAVEQYKSNLDQRVKAEGLLPLLDNALKICVEERQTFTDGIMSEIAQTVGELYEKVHPGEQLNKIALPLDPNKRSSLNLKADFAGKSVLPQAYFSQSHLDTLGLCVFVALALRQSPENKILILDDVLGSIDEPHVERVIQMIYEVSQKFQHAIVTTHYRPWKERFRWGKLQPEQACQFVELKRWTLQEGMREVSSIPEVARLKKLLKEDDLDNQAIVAKAGVILEATLDHLTLKYECNMPRRANSKYTIGDLLNAISSKLRDALVVEIAILGTDGSFQFDKKPLKPVLDKIGAIAEARNAIGAHFNELSFDLLDSDSVEFAKVVVELFDTIVDPEHGWPDNSKSGSHWRNSGDTRRLHPLKKPS